MTGNSTWQLLCTSCGSGLLVLTSQLPLVLPVETDPRQAVSVLETGLGLGVLFQSWISVLMSLF